MIRSKEHLRPFAAQLLFDYEWTTAIKSKLVCGLPSVQSL